MQPCHYCIYYSITSNSHLIKLELLDPRYWYPRGQYHYMTLTSGAAVLFASYDYPYLPRGQFDFLTLTSGAGAPKCLAT